MKTHGKSWTMEEPFEKGHFGGFDHGKWSGDEKKIHEDERDHA